MTTLAVDQVAECVARTAHSGQVNPHDGEDYILHVERVVDHLAKAGADAVVLAVAWLHDVVEDTTHTLQEIEQEFGTEIAAAVDAITHRKGETRLAYYDRVGENRLALAVKMSDIRDNTDPDRKAALAEATRTRLDRKYQAANRALATWIIKHLKEF